MDREEFYNNLERCYFGRNKCEGQEIDNLYKIATEIKIFYDVGASIGQYTYFISKLYKGCLIKSIEADPVRFEKLRENCTKWEKETGNKIIPIHAAISDKDGETVFFSTSDSLISGSLSPISYRIDKSNRIDVRAITLDSIMEEDNLPSLVKIDIEGGEYRALLGAKKMLEAENIKFLIELHPWGDSVLRKYSWHVVKLLYKSGYNINTYYKHYIFEKTDIHCLQSYLKFSVYNLKLFFSYMIWKSKTPYRVVKKIINNINNTFAK